MFLRQRFFLQLIIPQRTIPQIRLAETIFGLPGGYFEASGGSRGSSGAKDGSGEGPGGLREGSERAPGPKKSSTGGSRERKKVVQEGSYGLLVDLKTRF